MLVKILKRLRRKHSIRAKISWTNTKPRLSIFRSNSNIYAQIIDDTSWKTLCSSSDLKLDRNLNKKERAEKVWEDIATKAKELNINEIVFDRGWFAYHGRVEALASSARSFWLKF
jgi:large subunit ribosomal protein L18